MTDSKTVRKAVKLIGAINTALSDIDDKETVMAIASAIIDQWAADHDMTESETNEMFADMAAVAPIKHAAVGLPPKLKVGKEGN